MMRPTATIPALRSRSGMTLMELVIALAITGMMATVGAMTFNSIIEHRTVIRTASTSVERASALRNMVHSWLDAGNVQVPRGGGPRGLGRGATVISNQNATQAAAAGDELVITTDALTPALSGNVRVRLYVDADQSTPEKGLCVEFQANAQEPLIRRMLDSTIDSLRVEYFDQRTNKWFAATEAATISLIAVRATLISLTTNTSPILQLPIVYPLPGTRVNVGGGITVR